MLRQARLVTLFGFGMVLAMLSGCGNKTNAVKGQVVFGDGKPATELKGYLIMFKSEAHKDNANGVIQADGSFTVGTFKDSDGAMPGKHLVAITPPLPEVDMPVPAAAIPARYNSFETSKLEVIIKSGTNQPTITVERKK